MDHSAPVIELNLQQPLRKGSLNSTTVCVHVSHSAWWTVTVRTGSPENETELSEMVFSCVCVCGFFMCVCEQFIRSGHQCWSPPDTKATTTDHHHHRELTRILSDTCERGYEANRS